MCWPAATATTTDSRLPSHVYLAARTGQLPNQDTMLKIHGTMLCGIKVENKDPPSQVPNVPHATEVDAKESFSRTDQQAIHCERHSRTKAVKKPTLPFSLET
jgi:hypothetical protein